MLKVVHSSRRLLVILVALVSAPILMSLVNNSASAANLTPSVTVNSSLTVTIPSTPINLNLNPYSNNFGYGDVTITVGTNNPAGYKTIMTSADGTTNLTDSEDAEKVIPTLTTSGLTESTFEVNHWGYKKDSGNYQPFTTDTVVLESDTYANDDTTTLRFATKIDYMQPDGDYSTVLSFTTTATPNVPTIQNLDPTLCTTDPTLALDTRDNQMYTVQRLADGNCWMMDNLNLGAIDLTQDLTSDNTNCATSGSTACVATNMSGTPSLTAANFNSYEKTSGSGTYFALEYIPVSGNDTTMGEPGVPYGTLYNYCAASAGTICNSASSVDASYDLCPAGWRLPTGGSSGEFQTLYNQSAYNSNANMRKSYENGGAAFALAGRFYTSTPTDQGSNGRYWSSTRYSNADMYLLYLDTSNVYQAGSDYRNYGYSIRCVLKPQSMQSFTAAQASTMSTGETKTLRDARDGEEYPVAKLADGNIWLLDNLRLDPTQVDLDILKGNTNATDEILTYFKNGGGSSPYPTTKVVSYWSNQFDVPNVISDYKNNVVTAYGSGASGKRGVYYNYCAASAGSYCYTENASSIGGAQYDICPSGWKMPTGDTAVGSYYYLYNTGYSANTSSFIAAMRTSLAGYAYGSSGNMAGVGSAGPLWSSTYNADYPSTMNYAYITSTGVNPRAFEDRRNGYPVRCIFAGS